VLPALRLEPHSAFLAAYRLSRLSCPEALERSTTLDPDDPFTIPPGLTGRPTIPPHLLPVLPADERRARRLALLLDSDDPEIRDWAQAEYLKLGQSTRSLVREGVFEVKVTLEGADEPTTEDWSANEREEDLEKLRERLGRQKERGEEREEVEREMVWAREMFGKWLIDGRVDAVFRLAAGVLNELLKELARDEGEEWVMDEMMEEAAEAEEQPAKSSTVTPRSGDPSSKSTLATSKTLGADQTAPTRPSPAASVASSKRRAKERSEPAKEAEKVPEPEPELKPEPEPEPELTPVPEADPETKPDEPVLVESPRALSQAEPSPEQSPLPVPVPLPVLHPSIFSEEGLLTYAINAIHPDPPREPTPPVEPPRPESKLSSSNQTVTPQDANPAAVQHDTYADFYSKDPRRRKTPLLHVKPLPNNQPLPPKPEKEYDSYADFYANDSRLMRHVDDRPLPALVKKEAARKEAARAAERDRSSRPHSTSRPSKPDDRASRPQSSSKPSKPDDRTSRPQSSAKPSKLAIPSKAPADPARVADSKHRRRSSSRHRQRHKSPSSFEDFAVASNLSGDSGRLTTPAPSIARSRSRSRSREHRRSGHRKSGHRSRRHSPGLTSPTPSHASRRRRDSRARREAAPLPVPSPAPAPKRSWVPFRISGGAASPASSNASNSRAVSPEPVPVMPRGSPYNATMTLASDAGGEGGGADAGAAATEEAVVPPAPPLPPVQFWLPGFPAYKATVAGHSGDGDDRRHRRRHRDRAPSSSSLSSVTMSSSSSSRFLPPPPPPPVVAPPPVFLALGARRACVPYTPAFQGIDLRVVRPLSAREKLAMRDAVGVLVRLGARVVGAEAGGLGVRGEMWSLSYVGF